MQVAALNPARVPSRETENDPSTLLVDRFLQLTRRGAPLPCMSVRVRSTHTVKSVDLDTPLLVLPLQGRKRVRRGDEWIHIRPGELFFVPEPTAIDIENNPDPTTGAYVAIGIPLEEHVLSAAGTLLRQITAGGSTGIASLPLTPHCADLMTWIDAVEANEFPRACHALVGIVLRLYASGYRCLLQRREPSLSMRVRALIAADPGRDWSSPDLEVELAMSGATLRRHLATEGRGLRELIADARLSHALNLLITTRLPVKAVARQVGYASVSTFIKRFRQRYGVPPSRVTG
jgi:AraC-like DNA-binding protein